MVLGSRARLESSAHLSMSDDTAIDVSWLATASAAGLPPISAALRKYFTLEPRAGLFRGFGIPHNLWVVPQAMTPKDGFHRLATPRLGFNPQARTPYPSFKVNTLEVRISSVKADLFPGDVLVVRVSAQVRPSAQADLGRLLADLQALRSPKKLPKIDILVREVIGLSRGDRNIDRTAIDYEHYFALAIRVPVPLERLEKLLDGLQRELVALLIGAQDAALLHEDLVDRVLRANTEINTKAQSEVLLLNRQGAVYVLPRGRYRGPHVKRWDRTCDLAELALYARSLLRDAHDSAVGNRRLTQFIVAHLEQWIRYPELVFDASVSHTITWVALTRELLLEARLDAWRTLLDAQVEAGVQVPGSQDWWSAQVLSELMSPGPGPSQIIETRA